jgi:hypothetical protein
MLHFIDESTTSGELFTLGTTAAGQLRAIAKTTAGGGTGIATSTGTYTANSWHHAAGTFASSTLREIFLNGTGGDTNTTTVSFPTGLDGIRIGIVGGVAPGDAFDGDLAEVAVWNVVLTDAEIQALANGASPNYIRRGALVGYWPVWSDSIGEDFTASGNTLTNTGTTAANHVYGSRYVPMPHSRVFFNPQVTDIGSITGSVQIAGRTPISNGHRVRLYDRQSGALIATTTTDSSGNWVFNQVDGSNNREHYIVTLDND